MQMTTPYKLGLGALAALAVVCLVLFLLADDGEDDRASDSLLGDREETRRGGDGRLLTNGDRGGVTNGGSPSLQGSTLR